jgi:hypothetical protein
MRLPHSHRGLDCAAKMLLKAAGESGERVQLCDWEYIIS